MENLSSKQKYMITGVAVLMMILGFVFLQFKQKDDIVIDQGIEVAEPQEQELLQPQIVSEPKKIIVHVAGEVNNSGVVELTVGCRVTDALQKAGGVTKFADVDQLNLAAQLADGEKVYVPKKGEKVANMTPQTQSKSTIININTANKDDLDRIPGVGPSTVAKIIDYRKTKGIFKKIEDIKNVSGIGDKKFENIKAYITT
ncbi:MAG TPA: transporter [Lachnospiraceae bacterium]|nr:transporter [Lachnospiraceae bacterium]